jgi:hypothetical protein
MLVERGPLEFGRKVATRHGDTADTGPASLRVDDWPKGGTEAYSPIPGRVGS